MFDSRTIFINGRVHTLDPSTSNATALAVQNDAVLAAGSDSEVEALQRPGDNRIDLGGRAVIPGLVDSHIHLHWSACARTWIDLYGISSLYQVLTLVASRAKDTPPGEWILGQAWNQNLWPGRAFPTAVDLDRVAPSHPVYLRAQSGHASWANSLALKLAGVNAETPDPPGGRIQRDESGRPTGILLEDAMEIVNSVVPKPSPDAGADLIANMLPALWAAGITGVHCMDGGSAFEAMQILHQRRELKLRVLKYLPLERLDHAIGIGLRTGFGDEWLRVGGIKLFLDGALGVRTATMFDPYENEPNNRGIPIMDSDALLEIGRKSSKAGLSLAVHAIGDRANRMALDLFQVLPLPGVIPHRIEHVQLLHPADLGRLAALNITGAMQPIHATSDMEIADRHWGARARTSYAFRSLLDRGTRLAFGSDAPVEPFAPLLGIHAAVSRRRLDGSPGPAGWYPEQRLTLSQALAAYSVGPAAAAGQAHRMGTLNPGRLADLVVLDRDLYVVDPMEIPETRVLGTMIGGEWVHPLRDWS
jgi:predicted amidohydrolase YtcJ